MSAPDHSRSSPTTDAALSLLRGGSGGRRELPEIGLRGIGLHAISEVECVEHVMAELEAGRGGSLVTPNLDHMRRLIADEEFRASYDEADVRVPDGMVLVWASRLQRTPLPERVTGSNLVWSLTRAAAQRGRSIYLLGGNPGTDVGAADVLRERAPGLRVAGTECPPMGFDRDPLAMARLTERLRAAAPDIVFVALGSPKQERLVQLLRHELPGTWWVGCGISFSLVCGDVARAPVWMQRLGLEWLHRFSQEPGRLFRRYFVQGMPFAATLLGRSLLRGMLPKGRRAFRYGARRPRALLVDDDPFALDRLALLVSSRFPDLEVVKRDTPDASGDFDFYFVDNDFGGDRLAGRLAREIRHQRSRAMIFALSGRLDVATLKALINAGCDGACAKDDPDGWARILDQIDRRLRQMADRHRSETGSFGGVRHAAESLYRILADWNRRGPVVVEDLERRRSRAGRDEEPREEEPREEGTRERIGA